MTRKISEEGLIIISNLTDIPIKEFQKALQSDQEDTDQFDEFDSLEEIMPFYHQSLPDSLEHIAIIKRIITIATKGIK